MRCLISDHTVMPNKLLSFQANGAAAPRRFFWLSCTHKPVRNSLGALSIHTTRFALCWSMRYSLSSFWLQFVNDKSSRSNIEPPLNFSSLGYYPFRKGIKVELILVFAIDL